jgi:hypothetical protein
VSGPLINREQRRGIVPVELKQRLHKVIGGQSIFTHNKMNPPLVEFGMGHPWKCLGLNLY